MSIQDAEGEVHVYHDNNLRMGIREFGRNIRIYSSNNPYTILGGLVCTEGMTNGNFYSMVEIMFEFDSPCGLRNQGGETIPRDDQCLEPGNYAIFTDGSLKYSKERWLPRTYDITTETQNVLFRTAVRERDGGCVITGQPAENREFGFWHGFDTVHIFPPSFPQQWIDYNFATCLTPSGSDDSINSVQNGILLTSQMRALFESYIISINPDDNYKVVCFQQGWSHIGGRHLDKSFIENHARPPNELLRWHFRQAVLANMVGIGQPAFEFEPPCGWKF